MNNYILGPVDTDSISICKPDMSLFTEEEKKKVLQELDKLDGENIRWGDDGTYDVCIVLAAKNYVLYDGKKLKIKGSALKDSKKEQALKEFSNEIIWAIIKNEDNFIDIYHKYVKEAMNVTDIKKWSSKKTVTEKVYTSDRTNELKILEAIKGTDYREGDKVWLFFRNDNSLCLAEKFDGDYNKLSLLKKLYASTDIFSSVIDTSKFLNYSLQKNQKELETLISV